MQPRLRPLLAVLALWTLLVAYHRVYDVALVVTLLAPAFAALAAPEAWGMRRAERPGQALLLAACVLLLALAGAGLDVFEHGAAVNPRLHELENVMLLPQMGSATVEGRVEMGEKVIINIKTFADGHRPPDQVVPSML